ncbi:hypothetical protein Tco_1202913 [Tanacetum coccineum]
MLKVSPWKWVVLFGKRGKLNPRYVGPFKVLKKVRAVAYKHPQELDHGPQYVSGIQLEKCLSDYPLVIPLEGLQFDGTQCGVPKLYVERDRSIQEEISTPHRQDPAAIIKCEWISLEDKGSFNLGIL